MQQLLFALFGLAPTAFVAAQGGGSGTNVCTVNSIDPSSATVCKDKSITFTASVTSGGSVTWSQSGGEITASGNKVDFKSGSPGNASVTAKCGTSEQKANICVVDDPGNPPSGTDKVDYNRVEVSPFINEDGGTRFNVDNFDVTVAAYFDCESGKWKGKVTKAVAKIEYFARLAGNAKEASVDAATTRDILCKMTKNLQDLGTGGDVQWYMKQAVEEHEKAHFEDWQTELNKTFPKMKTTIENLSVDHECGKTTADDALDALKNNDELQQAIVDAFEDAADTYEALGDPNDRTESAERAVVDPMIQQLEQKRVQKNWSACPQ
jgi:hypothetical protein